MESVDVVEVVIRPLPWERMGLSYTGSGYGDRIPSSRMVRLAGDKPGRFRRVYVTCYSNAGTAWVIRNGARVTLPDTLPDPVAE